MGVNADVQLVVLADNMDWDQVHDVVTSMYTSPKGRAAVEPVIGHMKSDGHRDEERWPAIGTS